MIDLNQMIKAGKVSSVTPPGYDHLSATYGGKRVKFKDMEYEVVGMESLTQQLILRSDGGMETYAFPREVEIMNGNDRVAVQNNILSEGKPKLII